MSDKKHLGKLLPIGDYFESTSKPMSRYRWGHCRVAKELSLKKGYRGYFTKGKRRYFCEVMGISRTTTGVHDWKDLARGGFGPPILRWWQFTYVVQIIEN